MKRTWKIGLLALFIVSAAGCAKREEASSNTQTFSTRITNEETQTAAESVGEKNEGEELSVKETEHEETTEAQAEPQSKDEQTDGKWADSGEDRFIEGYDVIEKKVTLSLSDTAFPHCYLPDGELGKVLGEREGMLYLEGFHDIQSGGTSVCRVSAEEGGEAEVLFELEPFAYMKEIGMIGDHFYFLYFSTSDDGLVNADIYEYEMDGKYQVLDNWKVLYAPDCWGVGHNLICCVTWEDRCELWVYDLESGEKKLIKKTNCTVNEDKTMTGESIQYGGALDSRGFCYETAELENEYLDSASKYNAFYYDLETGESKYLYSPQHQSIFMEGDEEFLLRTESTNESPLKNPTTLYDETGEWGRIAIPGVDIGRSISDVKKIEEGKYLLCNYKAVGVLELENKSITWYTISVDDFPEEWVQEGFTAEYLTEVYLSGSDEQILCVDCVNECILIKLSDLQKAGQ
ncbi:MAG: hypothetical protein HFI65_00060 [Lachnospiraceae bacterium]|nr:hypothetical protein [Lachnospiraceae bacterium]